MPYYYLFAQDNGENVMLKRESHVNLNIKTGEVLDDPAGSDAVVFSIHADEEYGYDQFDPDFEGEPEALNLNQRMLDYYEHDSLMSERLLNAMGPLEGMQKYPVKFDNLFNDESLSAHYYLVNIANAFHCDEISHPDSPSVLNDPSKLVIDESKTGHCKIFRLKPFVSTIVVSEDIAKSINSGPFKGVVAYPLPT